MPKVILVYANCVNPTARGDFSLAGSIARDLVREIKSSGEAVDVVLTSTLDGISRFESLYGKPGDKRVTIEGEEVGLCALELFDAVENTVVAFIEANRCKYAPADIVKRVLSPESKILFVGAANQNPMSDLFSQTMYRLQLGIDQPGVYSNFDSDDLFVGSSGIGADRLGLPAITKAVALPALTSSQTALMPKTSYGFMYLAAIDDARDYKLIAQYMRLTDSVDSYVLVGNFAGKSWQIADAYRMDTTLSTPKRALPPIVYHQALDNGLMRHMTANASTSLVLSTGVMGTLEAMQDRKLTYYQDLSNNTEFVASYLLAVKSIVASDTALWGAMPQLIIELSQLLFAQKPLKPAEMERTHDLLAISAVSDKLVAANEAIVAHANGKLAPKLLSFIGGAKSTHEHAQLASVCISLRKPGEMGSPLHDQALRRAAAWGRLFELKVLIKAMAATDGLNLADATHQRTALHWAVIAQSADCVRALVVAGVLLDVQDKEGRTPLHHAIANGNRLLIQILVEAGASLDIPDNSRKSPMECADEGTVLFIQSCKAHHSAPVTYSSVSA
ncbi:Dot/Icm T4SS effector AnkY/LegA9 [Legionella oakridgensis]|uniref:Ankyrin repeat protein n=2 Tax=Legionella oakridgensis TaxID=29423 RepID=W0B9Y2_9GAMM|nr:Dot/Icm T4SS effector AnkY/LegA9 [Legionella oakridgensis]AHE67323.1 ankyrin repeat protein [Legionella oakridgensis ATCC 33761 = DSM 21215]ETO93073.1 ankyrin repeat protein [Legionella oakridgensis RV-2-2007]KTD37891.1 ankyrin repeat protein [Legionella oakridgensis]STY20387.1 Ankyrin-repeat containing protein. Substrate of the Dot/Icm secretion system [Legionella longbeachae]